MEIPNVKGIRKKLYYFLKCKVYKVPEGYVLPSTLLLIRKLLFPIEYLSLVTFKKCPGVEYHVHNDTYTIFGTTYSGHLLRQMGGLGVNKCATFRIEEGLDGINRLMVTNPKRHCDGRARI